MRISLAVNLRFPGEGSSAQGEAGPKLRSKDVGDGQLVHIPAPLVNRYHDGGTQEDRPLGLMVVSGQAGRESGEANPLGHIPRSEYERRMPRSGQFQTVKKSS